MMDDDDEDAFGEFSFSSFSAVQHSAPDSRSNGVDEDEWGDFVRSPKVSAPSSHDLASPPRWVKPTGALPLSIFGDVEEEEEEEKVPQDFDPGRINVNAGGLTSNNPSNSNNVSMGELYTGNSPMKAENGVGLNSSGMFGLSENDSIPYRNGFNTSPDLNQNGARSESSSWKDAEIGSNAGGNDQSQLSVKPNVSVSNQSAGSFSDWTLNFNNFSSSSNTENATVNSWTSNLEMDSGKPKFNLPAPYNDDFDDGWEFQDAYSESRPVDSSSSVDSTAFDVSARNTNSSGNLNSSPAAVNLSDAANEPIDLFSEPTEAIDFFANPTGIFHGSSESHLENVQPSKAEASTDTNLKLTQNDTQVTENESHIQDAQSSKLDGHFGEFAGASADTTPKRVEKDMNSNGHRSPIPLSLFGSEEPDIVFSPNAQGDLLYQSSFRKDDHYSPTSVVSINDLISSLYSQTEKISLSETAQKPTIIQTNVTNSLSSSNLVNDTDHLHDSWDFKDAFSQTRGVIEKPLHSFGDTSPNTSSKPKMNTCLDFYLELRKRLYFFCKHHIENLKCKGDVLHSVEDARAEYLDSEFQLVCKELQQMGYPFDEGDLQDHHPSASSYFNELVEILRKPQFQILESEYHLSQRLLLVEKDMESVMELMRHISSMLKILTLGTSEEQTTYVSLWSDIISVCTRELEKGVLIWAQAAKQQLENQLLSETKGRDFVFALGEIYRVVVILGASAKLYKPWIISDSVNSSSICSLLEESHALWSTSGLDAAISSVSVPSVSDGSSLLNSIKSIRSLDAPELQNYVLAKEESICRLSMLSREVAPGLKMIKWEDDHYFVTIANLWANLILSDPPKLPRLLIQV